MKTINLFLIVIFIQGCGFESIYSSKNFLFEVGKVNFEDTNLNRQIVRSLKSVSNEEAKKKLNINLSSKKEKRVTSKTKTGDPKTFELIISANIETLNEQKTFISKQNYNNNDNKFQLNQYEIEIEEQLINKIIDDIITYFVKI